MNQGKLDVVKQDMAWVNTDISGISELKWMGIGKFNLDDYYINNRGQESLRKQGQQKSPNCIFGCSLNNNRMISVHFQGKPFKITVTQVYALTTNAEEVKLNNSMKT